MSLSLYLFVCLSLYLPQFMSLSLCLFVSLSLYLPLSMSLSLCIFVIVSSTLHLLASLSLCLFFIVSNTSCLCLFVSFLFNTFSPTWVEGTSTSFLCSFQSRFMNVWSKFYWMLSYRISVRNMSAFSLGPSIVAGCQCFDMSLRCVSTFTLLFSFFGPSFVSACHCFSVWFLLKLYFDLFHFWGRRPLEPLHNGFLCVFFSSHSPTGATATSNLPGFSDILLVPTEMSCHSSPYPGFSQQPFMYPFCRS